MQQHHVAASPDESRPTVVPAGLCDMSQHTTVLRERQATRSVRRYGGHVDLECRRKPASVGSRDGLTARRRSVDRSRGRERLPTVRRVSPSVVVRRTAVEVSCRRRRLHYRLNTDGHAERDRATSGASSTSRDISAVTTGSRSNARCRASRCQFAADIVRRPKIMEEQQATASSVHQTTSTASADGVGRGARTAPSRLPLVPPRVGLPAGKAVSKPPSSAVAVAASRDGSLAFQHVGFDGVVVQTLGSP